VDGPIHVTAVATDEDFVGSVRSYAWPLATLATFLAPEAGDPANMIDPSILVTATDDIKKLRELRGRYLMDRETKPGLYVNWDGLKVVEKDVSAFVYMRDSLPYEDAQGLLRF